MNGKLLIIDDEPDFCTLLKRQFGEVYDVVSFTDPGDAVRFIMENPVDVILTDIRMPGMSGMEILKTVKAQSLDTDVILMSAYATVNNAIEAMKQGAYDYIVKPFGLDEISLRLKRLFEKRALLEERTNLSNFIDTKYRPETIIGDSVALRNVRRFIERVSRTDATVLITGENGTGKQLVAKTLHVSGKRKGKRFMSVHCGAIPQGVLESELFGHEEDASFSDTSRLKKGLYEEANGGTLLFIEIGDMDLSLQAKLLGVLENRSIKRIGGTKEIPLDVMVIATSNKDLSKLLEEGKFRKDLFYRLSMFNLHIPPLRDRREDIPLLAEYFFSQYKNEFEKPAMQMEPATVKALQNYEWSGNVRQLKNLFMKICLLEDSDVITPMTALAHLPKPQGKQVPLPEGGQSLDDIEKTIIQDALQKAGGNMTMASKLLNISYDKLRYRMKKFGIAQSLYKCNL